MSASTVRARTTSVDQTRDLAAALAELARPGDLLVLVGDLGAGKMVGAAKTAACLQTLPGPFGQPRAIESRKSGRFRPRIFSLACEIPPQATTPRQAQREV